MQRGAAVVVGEVRVCLGLGRRGRREQGEGQGVRGEVGARKRASERERQKEGRPNAQRDAIFTCVFHVCS